jgi:hypothetical protein
MKTLKHKLNSSRDRTEGTITTSRTWTPLTSLRRSSTREVGDGTCIGGSITRDTKPSSSSSMKNRGKPTPWALSSSSWCQLFSCFSSCSVPSLLPILTTQRALGQEKATISVSLPTMASPLLKKQATFAKCTISLRTPPVTSNTIRGKNMPWTRKLRNTLFKPTILSVKSPRSRGRSTSSLLRGHHRTTTKPCIRSISS